MATHVPESDVHGKGLREDSLGVFGGTIIGISCVAPAYVLTATLGILATSAGTKMPWVIIAGFLPMFFAAYAYRELNRAFPDCGTSFTWTTKAFGPYVGWLGGWTAVVATIIVLSNLAGVAVQFFYQFIGTLTGNETISDLWLNKPLNVATCLLFLAISGYVAYRGIEATERIQIVLVLFQLLMLGIFAVAAIAQTGESGSSLGFSLDWFSPTGLGLSAFIAGLSGSIFAFWGWDSALTVNEESSNSNSGPGLAALLCVFSVLLTYLLVAVATQMYAGVGEEGLGLANPDVTDNVFGNLAGPILGSPMDLMLYLSVLASSAASLMTTYLPTTRTILGMAAYKALPSPFERLHPDFKSPSVATVTAAVAAGVFYTVMTIVSERVLTDTILSLGIMICFYYGLTAFACIWYFKDDLFTSGFNIVFKFLFPLLGGLGLFVVLIITLRDSASPDYGSGASIGGVGLVLVLGVALIAIGIVAMLAQRTREPAFFRGETLHRHSAPKTEAELLDE